MSTEKKVIGTINLVPTWKAAAQIFIAALEHGTGEGVQSAREGIMEMATKFDAYIASKMKYVVYGSMGCDESVQEIQKLSNKEDADKLVKTLNDNPLNHPDLSYWWEGES